MQAERRGKTRFHYAEAKPEIGYNTIDMLRLFLIILLSLLSFQPISAQQPDQRIGELINTENWFGLEKEYTLLKDSIQAPYLKVVAEAMIARNFNQKERALECLNELLSNYQSDLGAEVFNFIILRAQVLEEMGRYALSVGVTAPFYLAKLFAPHFAQGAAIVNISSSRDRMSQPQTESYTAAKGGIAALTHALAVSLAGKVRVNSISPGWIDTTGTIYQGPDAVQQPAGRVGNPMDIAHMVLFLCSDKAGFITGENICIDGGMTRQMIYHGDHGWTLKP